MRKGLAHKTLT